MSERRVSSRTGQDTPLNGALDLPPVRFFFIAKGFARIFWGLLIAMILFFGNAAFEVFHFFRIPAYVVGSILMGWGLWILPEAGAVSRKWKHHVRVALVLVGLEIYFAPFFEWWKMSPHESFYLINMLSLLLTGMLALFYINLLAADVFYRLQDRGGQIEALVFAGGVILLMMVPLLLMVFFCLVAAIRYQTDFEFEVWQAIVRLPLWVYMVLTLPCSLTLIASWKAKDLGYSRLGHGEADSS